MKNFFNITVTIFLFNIKLFGLSYQTETVLIQQPIDNTGLSVETQPKLEIAPISPNLKPKPASKLSTQELATAFADTIKQKARAELESNPFTGSSYGEPTNEVSAPIIPVKEEAVSGNNFLQFGIFIVAISILLVLLAIYNRMKDNIC